MNIANPIYRRLLYLMLNGLPFTADDMTDEGRLTVAGDHEPNKKQSTIGALIRSEAKAKRIEKTGRTMNSKSPHRRGGLIQEWKATEAGQAYARARLRSLKIQ